jgi:hypothetical protein
MTKKKKAAHPKPAGKRQPTSRHPLWTERERDEIYFMKRFLTLGLADKSAYKGVRLKRQVALQEVQDLLHELQLAIIERRIEKKSRYASQVRFIQDKLVLLSRKKEKQVRVEISKRTYNLLSSLIALEKVRLSVRFLKRYIDLNSKKLRSVRSKIIQLRQEMQQALNKEWIKRNDPFFSDIKYKVIPSLSYYIDGKGKQEQVLHTRPAGLHGPNVQVRCSMDLADSFIPVEK